MLTAAGRRQWDMQAMLRDTVSNTPEWPNPTRLSVDTTTIHSALHGSFYFLTPGVTNWHRLSCGNLQDAIPILHRLQLDLHPTGVGNQCVYASRYPQWDIVEDIVKRRDHSRSLDGTAWNQTNDSTGGSSGGLLASAVKPAIPVGAMLDTQHKVTVWGHLTDHCRSIDTDTMQPCDGDVNVDRLCASDGWTVAAEPLVDRDGRWTFLLREPSTTTSAEKTFKVVHYGPGPNPQATTVAVFKSPATDATWIDCFAMTDDLVVVGVPTASEFLFLLLTPQLGITAVYRTDKSKFVKAVNVFHGGNRRQDLFIDCVVNEHDRPRDHLNVHSITATPCKLTRYSLLAVPVESARFDGAAGQLHRAFPVATRHLLSSEQSVDEHVQVSPRFVGKPARFVYGRCLSKQPGGGGGVGRSPYYDAVCKIDTVDRQQRPLEWTAPNCFMSPVCLVSTVSDGGDGITVPRDHDHDHYDYNNTNVGVKTLSDNTAIAARSLQPTIYAHEDDILVACVVRDVVAQRSWLVFMDGHDMEEAGRVELPVALPLGLSPPIWVPRD